ncbi:hypothetical protein EWB00_010678 [Schistosoma japonicum]|uniref:Saposin B-type domain-containing protein n=3 Tax=Schistosoma japonicum TaxID=6182 RepID=A0A4Z2DNG0_SCHJA|nr:hypothetical protein EWB00_010678 [Schistosoma japonicum]
MFNIQLIVLTICTMMLFHTAVTNAKSELLINIEEIECDICMGVMSFGKLFLVSPIMDKIKKKLIEKLCTLPLIVTQRCIHWGKHELDQLVFQLLKQQSSQLCLYASFCLNTTSLRPED